MEESVRRVMSTDNISVLKRDGSTAPFNIEKIHKMVERACEDITGVSVSDVEMEAHLSFYDGITSVEIHRALTKAATNLISENSPNYQYVAGRLLTYDIRKTAWGGMNPPRLYDHVKRNVEAGFYTAELLELYSEEEWDKLDTVIDHDRDLRMAHIGVKEYLTKYAVRDRSLDDIVPIETPQFTYMIIAALMRSDSKEIKDIKSYYNDISMGNISLPTPIMAGMRTPTKQFSSCVLIECGDSLDSISASNAAIQKYVSKKAGIGVGASGIRAEGSGVAGNTVKHTGVIPFFRQFQSTTKSCSQGGVRGGAATCHVLLWHLEIENILVLKNNKGTQDNRVRQIDYSVLINDYLYKRLIEMKSITLFSPNDTPDLYEKFFENSDEFGKLYEKYEKRKDIRSKEISAKDLFESLMIERKDTGRIYVMNVDNVNKHSSFQDPVRMSNLCQEITLNTVPMATTESYEIYVPKVDLINVMNELGKSDLVKNFEIVSLGEDDAAVQ
jgi:ribonucleoside-diphosphate reductase alpha chain